MKRSTLDKLIASTGLVVAVALLAAAGGMIFAYNFIHSEVRTQLSAQHITFPAANSESLSALPAIDRAVIAPYAGQQLTTGAQAKAFADHYIAVHLRTIGGGKTYAQLSSASIQNPSDSALATQVQTVFRGETLRGMLLNAYAFDTMATVARIAAFGAIIASAALLVLASLGYRHAAVVKRR